MSDQPRDLTLERVNRLTQAVADLMDNQTSQGRMLARMIDQMASQLARMEGMLITLSSDVRALASEQVLLGNRVENAFSRALRTNIRLDQIEDAKL